jgi:hypothetical protein
MMVDRWDPFVNQFIESYFLHHPDLAIFSGRHEFDGKLPDWSSEALKQEISRLRAQRDSLLSFDTTSLDDRCRFEREYLLTVIEGDLFWSESAEQPYRNPAFYRGALDPNVYVSRPYASPEVRLRAYTLYAKAIPVAVEQIKKNLRTPLPRTYVDIGKVISGGLASYYEDDVPAVFGEVKDESLQLDFRAANQAAIKAMKELDSWFDEQRPAATENFALGPKLFAEMLHATERVDVPLDELEKTGRQDLERNLVALREACAVFAPGRSIEECTKLVRSKKPKGGPVESARRQLIDLKEFLAHNNLLTVPGPEEALVKESPPYQRANSAYIDVPGPYEKNLPSVYYIAPPDPTWSQKERNDYIPAESILLFTSVHEVWPGHFLQFLHSNRASSKLAQVFTSYAFVEGWAHYAEEMMWDAGLRRENPEFHIGQLLNALRRDVRFLSAIGLHTGKLTVEQSEQMFREQAYQDVGTAKQQAARGTYDPAYLNYTLGKLMIRKLRNDWTATRGGRAAWREFHDTLLSYGSPPVPLVRKRMLASYTGSLF